MINTKKRSFLFVVFVVFIFLLSLATKTLKPKLIVENLNIGTFEGGKDVFRNLNVKNSGFAKLKIFEVKPCCGTELPEGFPEYLPPRSTITILLKIKTSINMTDLEKSITLITNDTKDPIKKILISGREMSPLKVKPGYINLGYVYPCSISNFLIQIDNTKLCLPSDKVGQFGCLS